MATIARIQNVTYFDGRDVVGFWVSSQTNLREPQCALCGAVAPLADTCCELATLGIPRADADAILDQLRETEAVPALA